MTAIAIRRNQDVLKFIGAAILALIFAFFLMMSAARTAAPSGPGVTVNPCKTCSKCVCPRLAGSFSCGCPR